VTSNSSDNSSSDDASEFRSIVAALDEFVPRAGSWIQMTQYGGGPDEGQILGNTNGYRRLGIEFLRATLDDDPQKPFGVDLEYLVSPDSTINFDWFEVSDTPTRTPSKSTGIQRVMPIAWLTLFAMVTIIFLIGMGTVFHWIAK
jgi:hypothetical protein